MTENPIKTRIKIKLQKESNTKQPWFWLPVMSRKEYSDIFLGESISCDIVDDHEMFNIVLSEGK